MMTIRYGLALSALSVFAASNPAAAQCATCGNPALTAGASDLGKALGEETVETMAVTLSTTYAYTNFDDFLDGNKDNGPADIDDVDLGEDYRLQLHVFVLNAELSHPIGVAGSLALPYGIAQYTKDGTSGADPGLADIEGRLRFDLNKLTGFWNKGSKPRLNVTLGAVAPTGEFVASSDIAASDRYVSLGRGVPWGLMEADLRGYTKGGYGWYVTGGLRKALKPYEGTAGYVFDWGPETRLSVGGSAQVIKRVLGLGAGIDWNKRGISYADNREFENGGGQDFTASLTAQGRLPGGVMASLGYRHPLVYQVRGIQVVPDPNVFLGLAYRIGGSKKVKSETTKPEPPKPSVEPGQVPTDPELLKLLGDNQVTVIDYWAEWCVVCMKFMPELEAWHSNNPHVRLSKMDGTKWEVEQFKRFLPTTPELPALDIYDANKRLIIRLGGSDVFKFREYLPEGVDRGMPEGWKGTQEGDQPAPESEGSTSGDQPTES